MTNRLDVHLRKPATGTSRVETNREDVSNPVVGPGRLPGIRNNVVRFAQCTSSKGDSLTVPVTVESNIRHTSKGQKRKRDAGEPSINFAKYGRKCRGKSWNYTQYYRSIYHSPDLFQHQASRPPRQGWLKLGNRESLGGPTTTTRIVKPLRS